MHVLIIPSWYPIDSQSISGIFFREQALSISRSGIKVGLVSPHLQSLKNLTGFQSSDTKTGFYAYDDDGIKTHVYYGWDWSFKISSIRYYHWLKIGMTLFENYVTAEGYPELIHAHCVLLGGILAHQIKRRYGIPFIITEHSSIFARHPLKNSLKSSCREVFSESSSNIVVSPALGEFLEREFSHKFFKWWWIPNPLSRIFENAFFSQRFLTAESSEREKGFVFLNIGVSNKNKGQDNLIKAFSMAFKGSKKVRLEIGGDGPYLKPLKELVRQEELEEQVLFLGRLGREQVLHKLLQADALVLSSHYETFGIVLIEALACGKPVVATRCGGPECIVDQTNGLLVETNNIQDLSLAMLDIQKNIATYDRISIRNSCIEKFGQATVISQIKKVYSTVLNE